MHSTLPLLRNSDFPRIRRISVDLTDREIGVMDHCYGCTAGQGPGCGGALSL
jgi:hypothetical protein